MKLLSTIIVVTSVMPSLVRVGHAAMPSFSEQTVSAGLVFTHAPFPNHRSSPMVAGGAVGDFDNDGYPDLFVIGGGAAADALFINNRDGTFTDRASAWGVDTPHRGVGCTVADYDGDGDDDIYVTSLGPVSVIDGPGHHILYRNDGGIFNNVAVTAGVATTTPSHPDGYGSAFGDYDRDGDLDLFVGGWHGIPSLGSRLFRNEGDGTFVDVTQAAGVIGGDTHAFGAVWADMDGDRYPELLVAGDFGTSRYYRNNRDGTFLEIDPGSGLAVDPVPRNWSIGQAHNGMGATVADFNRDGLPDWFITAIWPTYSFATSFWGNGLYINHGDHIFTEAAQAAGVHDGGWGWGTAAVDVDNDGWIDLVMTNGWPTADPVTQHVFQNEPAYLWRNRGDLTFAEIGVASGLVHTGQGRALLHFDYDRDGDVDIAILSDHGPLQLYRNDLITSGTPGDANWLRIRLDTTGNDRLAPHGVGARITVRAGDVVQTQAIVTGGTYVGQGELIAHFGLGAATVVDQVRVDWGNGKVTRLRAPAINRRLTIRGPCPPRRGKPGQYFGVPGPPTGNCSLSGSRP